MSVNRTRSLAKSYRLLTFLFLFFTTISYSQTKPDSLVISYSDFVDLVSKGNTDSALAISRKLLATGNAELLPYVEKRYEILCWNKLYSSKNKAIQASYLDTLLSFYRNKLKRIDLNSGYYKFCYAYLKDFISKSSADEKISLYEEVCKNEPNLSLYYIARLTNIYLEVLKSNSEVKDRTIELLNILIAKDSTNSNAWSDTLASLSGSLEEQQEYYKNIWLIDKYNEEKAAKYATAALKNRDYTSAIVPLEFLYERNQNDSKVLSKLGVCYLRLQLFNKAEESYKKLVLRDSLNQENFLNLGIALKELSNYGEAHIAFTHADSLANGWSLASFYDAVLFETVARKCPNYDFDTKLMYFIALSKYNRALSLGYDKAKAEQRIDAVKSLAASIADFDENKVKSGDRVKIKNRCFDKFIEQIDVQF